MHKIGSLNTHRVARACIRPHGVYGMLKMSAWAQQPHFRPCANSHAQLWSISTCAHAFMHSCHVAEQQTETETETEIATHANR